jgi:hypothetical protein
MTSCTITQPHAESHSSEWLPTIQLATALEDTERNEILRQCGLSRADQIWIRTLDLDRDNKEDCVVTVALPPESGPYWRNYRSLSYVFRGGNVGVFGLQWRDAKRWFSLVTYEGQDHIHYGDSETIRQFSVLRRNGNWCVSVREHEYGNNGGEARGRRAELRRSTSWTMLASKIPPASPNYP